MKPLSADKSLISSTCDSHVIYQRIQFTYHISLDVPSFLTISIMVIHSASRLRLPNTSRRIDKLTSNVDTVVKATLRATFQALKEYGMVIDATAKRLVLDRAGAASNVEIIEISSDEDDFIETVQSNVVLSDVESEMSDMSVANASDGSAGREQVERKNMLRELETEEERKSRRMRVKAAQRARSRAEDYAKSLHDDTKKGLHSKKEKADKGEQILTSNSALSTKRKRAETDSDSSKSNEEESQEDQRGNNSQKQIEDNEKTSMHEDSDETSGEESERDGGNEHKGSEAAKAEAAKAEAAKAEAAKAAAAKAVAAMAEAAKEEEKRLVALNRRKKRNEAAARRRKERQTALPKLDVSKTTKADAE